ncbi:CheR family methyltransferase [Pelosinus sp. sgz500959]|uniref:CheR family methyltransferase n=1 Tax=Pelosinus sp. sgz500959 TaxID=3242472 RepID=UPI003670CB78
MIDVSKDRSKKTNDFDENLVPESFLESEKAKSSKFGKTAKACFIVGIGVSDGGLDDLAIFLKKLPIETGMSFVVISNLSINRELDLLQVLQGVTSMVVREIDVQTVAEPNCVYLSTPGTIVTIDQRILTPLSIEQSYGMSFPVNIFFQSLAKDQGSSAIGIVLSGKSTDGAKGIQAIKTAQGLTFAQLVDITPYDVMPSSAIATGSVDYIFKIDDIVQELACHSNNHVISARAIQSHNIFKSSPEELSKIYILLKKDGGVKLEGYKEPTVYRRILRRMRMHSVENLAQYRALLERNNQELEALQRDVLIGYTKFFRDSLFFDALKSQVFPSVVFEHSKDEPVRIWVAGCSTGEEAYSVVMSLVEFLEEQSLDIPIQVFATDVSLSSIEKARTAIYSQSITADVSPERLKRFFIEVEGGYKIHSRIRETCLFARQNILDDPYFSRIDLVICRNVLIYFDLHAQKKAISRFYQALLVGGILALGISESIGSLSDLFSLVDKKAKIYAKKAVDSAISLNVSLLKSIDFETDIHGVGLLNKVETDHLAIERKANDAILNRYGTVGVLVNNELEILQFRGRTGKYLEHMPGKASLNMMKMLRSDLIFAVGAAVNQARVMNMPIKKENIQVNDEDGSYLVSIDIIPIQDTFSQERYFVVLFSDKVSSREHMKQKKKYIPDSMQLQKQELAVAQEYVRSVVEQYEGANDRLRTAYEEIQSSNEELQTTNEELETIKEEVQSTNEELLTSNEELQTRNDQLAQATGDIQNLFRSIKMTVIMLDKDLRIRRFNSGAEKMFRLIPTDIGRPLTDIKPQMDLGNFEEDIHQVMETLVVKESEVSDHDGGWYSLQIRPYRTSDNRIDGVVVLFFDISEINALKTSLKLAQDAYEYAATIIETIQEPFAILDHELKILSANRAFYEVVQADPSGLNEKTIDELGNRQWYSLRLRGLLNDVLDHDIAVKNFKLEYDFSADKPQFLEVNARLFVGHDSTKRILLAVKCIDGYTSR